MNNLHIEINMENDAFSTPVKKHNELERLFKLVRMKLYNGQDSGKLMDVNGNSVGSFELRN